MKKVLVFSAVVLLVGILGGCSSSDSAANSCADACKKLGSCAGWSTSDINECTTGCKQELAGDKSTQDIIDCIVKSSCANLGSCV